MPFPGGPDTYLPGPYGAWGGGYFGSTAGGSHSACPCGEHFGWSEQRAKDAQDTLTGGYFGGGVITLIPRLTPYGISSLIASFLAGFGCVPNS